MLKHSRDLVSGPDGFAVEAMAGEPSSVETPLAQLEASLAADQEWRKAREAQLRRGLRKAWTCGAWARAGCVTAGLLEWVTVLLFLGWWIRPESSLNGVAYVLATAGMGLLTLSGVVAALGSLLRGRLMWKSAREAIAVRATSTGTSLAETEFAAPDPRSKKHASILQQELLSVHEDESMAADVSMLAGSITVASWALLALTEFAGWEALLPLVSLSWLGIIIILPFSALISTLKGLERKRLLRRAAEYGLKVRDPARCPWD